MGVRQSARVSPARSQKLVVPTEQLRRLYFEERLSLSQMAAQSE